MLPRCLYGKTRVALRLLIVGGITAGVFSATPASAQAYQLPAGALVGGVVSENGSPLAGAWVQVEAWPNSHGLGTGSNGDRVDVRMLQTVTTAPDGSYNLSPNLAGLPSKFFEPNGAISVDINVYSPNLSLYTDFSLSAAASATAQVAVDGDAAVVDAAPERLNVDLGTASLSYARGSNALTTIQTQVGVTPGIGSVPNIPPPSQCTVTRHGFIYQKPEHFMHIWTWRYAPATVEETANSSHTLGVGVSIDGGPWHESGSTTSTTDTSNGGDSTYRHNWTLGNYVNYRHFTKVCPYFAGGHKTRSVHKVSYFSLLPDALMRKINPADFTHCATYFRGQHQWKTQGHNVQFNLGVNLGFVNLSASAQYSKNTKIYWSFRRATNLCGSTSAGPASSPQAAASNAAGCPSSVLTAPGKHPDVPC